jgi:hypothetical protein
VHGAGLISLEAGGKSYARTHHVASGCGRTITNYRRLKKLLRLMGRLKLSD